MNSECNEIQEKISWMRNLSNEQNLHILNCESCSQVIEENTKLNFFFEENLQVNVPDNFSDSVMREIAEYEDNRYFSIDRKIYNLFSHFSQSAAISGGLFIGIANLLRIAFSFLIPTAG